MAHYKDINKQFNSLAAFSRHIAAGTTQPAFLERYESDDKLPSQDPKHAEFSGTNSFDEADRLLRIGDNKSLELLKKYGFQPAAKNYNFGQRRKITPAVVGFAPIVPNAIAGVPVAMQAVTSQKVKTKVVNVVLCVSYDCFVKKEKYAAFAAKVLNGCLTLEKRGIRVNLYALSACQRNGQKVVVLIKIKDSKQAIDPLSISYPVINSSFLRRHILRFIETEPGINKDFTGNYGSPIVEAYELKKLLPKNLQNDTILTSYYDRNNLTEAFEKVK